MSDNTRSRPGLEVAVVMRREMLQGPMARWQPWRWLPVEVLPQEPGFGTEPRLLYKNESEERWLHGGLRVDLFADDAEGYLLNASTPAPCWFVLWRQHEDGELPGGAPAAVPVAVSLSYHDAGRWLDAQESVDPVTAPPDVVAWMREFAEAHHVAEPRRRQRPQSFRTLSDRFGNPASVSTDKTRGRRSGDAHGGG